MEDSAIRAITIGVGVFIAIATISAVMMYYNTAKETVRQIGPGTDIAGLYEKGIADVLIKANNKKIEVTGTEIKNIVSYFEGRKDAEVYMPNGIEVLHSTGLFIRIKY